MGTFANSGDPDEMQQNVELYQGLHCLLGPGRQVRVPIGKLFSLFLIQNICSGYSKEPSQ